MVGVALQIDVKKKELEATLYRLDTALSPLALGAFMTGVVVPYLHNRFQRGFDSESAPDGSGWAPLAEATIAIRESEGYGPGPINVRTGDLEEYITNSEGTLLASGDQAVLRYPNDKVPSGELGKKFRGAQRGEGRAPARPVVGLTPVDLVFFLEAVGGYIEEAVKL